MTDKVTPERITTFAAASRVPIQDDAAARIAKGVAPTVARLDALNLQLPLEIEPASFVVVARKGAKP
jgi:hypothetical protein